MSHPPQSPYPPPPGHYPPPPGQYPPPQPYGAYPPPPPPAPPRRRGNPVLRVIVTIVIMVVVVGGFFVYDAMQPPGIDDSKVGDCVTDQQDPDDIEVVACTDAKAGLKVVSIDYSPDRYDPEKSCEGTDATDYVAFKRKGKVKSVYCLAPVK
ncbi:hypothetical protein Afil01_01290 [Actinorhabdospora filicis]|uniref:Uncharacterized protein n=1 Tax=Actinorhabdospora filicis TaxID=1785913 RepID=A0A9W6W0Z5_9ACTN|nr:hypothetical protein [Actinorhabdospora filicis]GLZ75322.1 hypothetical protein Afil01_01290 [Actinorhabdospora filicis]